MNRETSLRERLVDVGVDLVMGEGASPLGLREIARRAGVSHGAPRRYFATHQALLSAIAHRGFADLEARFAVVTDPELPPRDQLELLGRTYVRYALECRGMFELMFRRDLLDSEGQPPDQPRLRTSTLPIFERIVALVAQCRTDPALVAAALWSNLYGIAQLWAWGSLQLTLDESGAVVQTDQLDRLVRAALEAHLGPVTA